MVINKFIPDAGDLVWVNFNPVLGHEQGGRRPALVITPLNNNKITHMVLMCPITSKIKESPFEITFSAGSVSGAILVNHMRSIDISARKIEYISRIDDFVFQTVLSKIRAFVG